MSTATVAVRPEPVRPEAWDAAPGFRRVWRKVFSDRPEHSGRLRSLTLLASLWAAGTLLLMGVFPLVPLLSAAGFAAGHTASYRFRARRLPLVSLAVAVFIIALGIGMRFELVGAIRGDRVPVAYFLLATGAASSFESRTRGGLYTQLVFAGIVMFFASELAFGLSFSVLLGGFGLVVLAFLATAYLEDQTEKAIVAPFASRSALSGFWAVVGVLLLVTSAVAFLLLPWNREQVPHGARLSVLPFSGMENGAESGITPEMARELMRQGAIDTGGMAAMESADGLGASAADGSGGADSADVIEGNSVTVRVVPAWARPLTPDGGGEDVVAYVRSGVASYWRGRVYDTYEVAEEGGAEQWYATARDDPSLMPIFSSPYSLGDEEQRYLQTFFVEQDFGEEILTGYDPVAIAVERDSSHAPMVREGATYQVISTQPEMSASDLRADRVEWQGRELAALPESWGPLHGLTARVVEDAGTDFDKAAAIASYLHGLEYDEGVTDPLESVTSMQPFLVGEAPGSAIDFATAMVLMARSAGLPARLATGYLPGKYSAYSGASMIDRSDAHAWAEIAFEEAGSVPFDAAPRADLPAAADVAKAPPSGFSNLLNHRLGDRLAQAIGRAPGGLRNGVESLLDNGLKTVLVLLALAVAGTVAWLAYLQLRRRTDGAGPDFAYALLKGRARERMLRAFSRLESSLRDNGFRRRRPGESFYDYAAAAGTATSAPADELTWFAATASRAAYSPAEFTDEAVHNVKPRLHRIRSSG